jgi:hypothetical protein
MKKYDFILILVGLFSLRIIALSGSYSDAICFLGLLAFKFGLKYLQDKKFNENVSDVLKKEAELNNVRFEQLAQEIVKVKNNNEAIKAAVNFNKR